MAAVQFTALIRLPFARADFVDPPQADWNATKDRALWKVISKSSKTSDLNWAELADRFQVPQTFLLQQAAWLYERHLEHVRTQMKKVGSSNAPTASAASGGSSHTIVGGVPMQRGGSHGSRASRTPSSLSVRPRDSPAPRAENSTPAPPPLSRTPSTNTITQSRAYPQSNPIRTQPARPRGPSFTTTTTTKPTTPVLPPAESQSSEVLAEDSPDATGLLSSSSSSSDSDMEGPAHRSQLFKRPPRFQKQRPRELISYDEETEEGDSPERSGNVILPFAQAGAPSAVDEGAKRVSNAPLTDRTRQTNPGNVQRTPTAKSEGFDASSSLASSASDAPKPPGPLSPKHRAELAKLSPRRQGTRSRKDGSEGTPSMGSSFSDLDDASLSQSALEEALLSNIQHGRMSTLSQLRSRYL